MKFALAALVILSTLNVQAQSRSGSRGGVSTEQARARSAGTTAQSESLTGGSSSAAELAQGAMRRARGGFGAQTAGARTERPRVGAQARSAAAPQPQQDQNQMLPTSIPANLQMELFNYQILANGLRGDALSKRMRVHYFFDIANIGVLQQIELGKKAADFLIRHAAVHAMSPSDAKEMFDKEMANGVRPSSVSTRGYFDLYFSDKSQSTASISRNDGRLMPVRDIVGKSNLWIYSALDLALDSDEQLSERAMNRLVEIFVLNQNALQDFSDLMSPVYDQKQAGLNAIGSAITEIYIEAGDSDLGRATKALKLITRLQTQLTAPVLVSRLKFSATYLDPNGPSFGAADITAHAAANAEYKALLDQASAY